MQGLGWSNQQALSRQDMKNIDMKQGTDDILVRICQGSDDYGDLGADHKIGKDEMNGICSTLNFSYNSSIRQCHTDIGYETCHKI
jgi:hypothetical protein